MRYVKTLNLWDDNRIESLIDGTLVLQPGQWILCGGTSPSRFCGVTSSGTIVATHPSGDRLRVDSMAFKSNLEYWRGRR